MKSHRLAAIALFSLALHDPSAAAIVNLTDLLEVSATVGYGTLGRDVSIDGHALKIKGTVYPRGLGVHAQSTVVYNLNKDFKTFTSDVGVDDETGTLGSVVFQVYADDVLMFDSGIMKGSEAAKKVNVSVAGKTTLKLVVNNGGDDIGNDHGDWAGPTLVPVDSNYVPDYFKIACVGNSITEGDGLADRATQGYVALIQKMLGSRYRVLNYGLSGRTMLKKGDYPYWNETKFQNLFAEKPDIITVMLGTNDSKPWNWTTQAAYEADYSAFVDSLATITNTRPGHARHPLILPGLITPVTPTNACCSISGAVIADQIIPAIRNVAKAKGLVTIDANTPFLANMGPFRDGVHPDSNGNKVLADIFYENLLNLGLQQTPPTRWLWYGQAPSAGAPAAMGNADADKPLLWAYPAPDSNRNGTAVIICPGGGYGALSIDWEGKEVARWLNTVGVSAFVLRYRFSPYRHPVEINDAKRAMRLVRYYASAYGLDTNRIGIMGFSAGGHLASTLETHFDNGNAADPDPINRKKSRPDFGVLIYPVITLSGPYAHTGSRDNLLGVPAPAALVDSLSNQKWVTAQTPPTFLAHGDKDFGVPIQNSQMFDSALKAKKIPDTLVVDAGKDHGYGMTGIWPSVLIPWLKAHNLIRSPVDIAARRDPKSLQVFSRLTVTPVSGRGVRFFLDAEGPHTLEIYAMDGRRVAELILSGSSGIFWPAPERALYTVRVRIGNHLLTRTISCVF